MFSILTPCSGAWPQNLTLPLPPPQPSEENSSTQEAINRRKPKEITACPHILRKHYAKNMCNNCYHKLGRDKFAWECEHSDRKHYAKGFCQLCYLKNYSNNKSSSEYQLKADKRHT